MLVEGAHGPAVVTVASASGPARRPARAPRGGRMRFLARSGRALRAWAADGRYAALTATSTSPTASRTSRTRRRNRGKVAASCLRSRPRSTAGSRPTASVDVRRHPARPGPGPCAWWSCARAGRVRQRLRLAIDFQLASAPLAARATRAEVGRAASYAAPPAPTSKIARASLYAERWSDHAPASPARPLSPERRPSANVGEDQRLGDDLATHVDAGRRRSRRRAALTAKRTTTGSCRPAARRRPPRSRSASPPPGVPPAPGRCSSQPKPPPVIPRRAPGRTGPPRPTRRLVAAHLVVVAARKSRLSRQPPHLDEVAGAQASTAARPGGTGRHVARPAPRTSSDARDNAWSSRPGRRHAAGGPGATAAACSRDDRRWPYCPSLRLCSAFVS